MIVKTIIILYCLAAAMSASDKYSDKYDNIDIDEMLVNRRLLEGYMNCFLDKGKCTPEGKAFKGNLKEAIETDCEKCTEVQKEKSTKLIRYLISNEQGYWKELCDKYDPDNVYRKKYEVEAREKGIIIPYN